MLGRIIARELRFDRDEGIRTAIEQAVREELESGQTEVKAQATIMGQWRRWQPIADLFPGIGTAQFFRSSRHLLSTLLEESAAKKAAAPPPRKQAQPVEREQPHPMRRYRTTERRNPKLTMATDVGRYDPSAEEVYSAEDHAFLDAYKAKLAKGIHTITAEDVRRYRIITGQEGDRQNFYGQK